MVQLVNLALQNTLLTIKGFILDLPLEESNGFSWLELISTYKLNIPRVN